MDGRRGLLTAADVVVNYRSLSIRDMTSHGCPVLETIVVVVTVGLALAVII